MPSYVAVVVQVGGVSGAVSPGIRPVYVGVTGAIPTSMLARLGDEAVSGHGSVGWTRERHARRS